MSVTILIIVIFQAYWLNRLYKDEREGLRKETDILFRETIYKIQMAKFKKDSVLNKAFPDNLFIMDAINAIRKRVDSVQPESRRVITVTDEFRTSAADSAIRIAFSTARDNMMMERRPGPPAEHFGRMLFRSTLGDSLRVPELDSAYRIELKKAKINLEYTINSKPAERRVRPTIDSTDRRLQTNYAMVGISQPMAYQARFENTFGYLFGKLTYPIIISLLLITLTTASFVFLYRNLLAQRRLTEIKNEFISNITHELKTPIATVNVAIEALKSFNAMDNPERTQEYLDISSAELQRLSLLVDKVLKLSLFENKDIELKEERFDLLQLTREVTRTMQLQLQKRKAVLNFHIKGQEFDITADKLHITSVIYNLLDNALKYSPGEPVIDIQLEDTGSNIELSVTDQGLGIPPSYQGKVFDKFFRVPHGNTHNIKGYGLGLSYAAHVVKKHNGSITIDSSEGKGSTFKVKLPKGEPGETRQAV